MKIYFTCSTAKFNKYRDSYFAIRKFLIDNEHVLTRDWLPHTEQKLLEGNTDIGRDIKQIYSACIKAINEAELVIIEDTVSNFSTGHQITVALQRKKPTLVLWQGRKHRQFKQMFIHGIDSDILEVKTYSMKNYKEIISAFIKKYENVKKKNRFHLVLSSLERKYLDWAQYNKARSRTKIIRDAIRDKIENDEDYDNYLKGNIRNTTNN